MTSLKHCLLFACISLLFLSSCKNELKLNAPYKEIPSIYAVLNPFERIQMIRVNKVFLGEGDANVMAKVADSVNYQPGELTITMNRYLNGVQIDASPNHPDPAKRRTIVFEDSVVTTADGAFNTTQRIYKCNDDLLEVLTPSSSASPATYTVYGEYVLTVKNNKTGNVFTAKASPINQVSPNQGYQPLAFPYRPYDPGTQIGFINYYHLTPTVTVGSVLFKPVDRGKVYDLIIRSHFYNDYASPTFDYVDYVFNDPKTLKRLSEVNFLSVSFRSIDYFSNLGIALAKKNLAMNVGRKMYAMEYIIYASTQEYADYMEFVKPSLSLNQNKPLYSNFDNRAALGVFTFRSECHVLKELDVVFVNAMSTNPNTCRYRFYDSNNKLNACK